MPWTLLGIPGNIDWRLRISSLNVYYLRKYYKNQYIQWDDFKQPVICQKKDQTIAFIDILSWYS